MSKRTLALLAATGATTIYGINHTVAKGVMPHYVGPYGFIMLRLAGATLLFWTISFLGPKQKIAKSDWGRIVLCALLGMAINMLSFFKGLQLSTPINSAVLITITPIIVVLLSMVWIKEKVTLNKGLGILLGFVGALTLILFGTEIRQDAPNIPLGNFLFVVNSTAYGAYLIAVKKLTLKYHPLVLMKWLFTIGLVICFPVTYGEFSEISWGALPNWAYGTIAFVILGTTFLTYLFNVFALQELKASTISAFTYVQPLFGVLFALLSGKDQLTIVKLLAIVLVFAGVYLASKPVKTGS